MIEHARLGRKIYGLGCNEAARGLSGISVNEVKRIVYSRGGVLASLAGMMEVARLSSAQRTAGTGDELEAIAAVVLGGIVVEIYSVATARIPYADVELPDVSSVTAQENRSTGAPASADEPRESAEREAETATGTARDEHGNRP